MPSRYEPKERKSFPIWLDGKDAVDTEERTVTFFAAVCGNFDGHDIIDKGAFKKTLQEMGHRVKSFWIHEFGEPIGKPIEMEEVPRSKLPPKVLEIAPDATGGLKVKIKVSRTRRGDEALVLAKDGVFDEGSIGYDTVKESWEETEDGNQIRHIKELKLYDVSLVPLAMNPAAIVTEVKMVVVIGEPEVKIEESDDFIHVPVSSEEGKHDGHRIRYIDIDADKGIRAKYCGECKVIISYVFAKENGWTVAKAVAWVKEHSKSQDWEREFADAFLEALGKETDALIMGTEAEKAKKDGEIEAAKKAGIQARIQKEKIRQSAF